MNNLKPSVCIEAVFEGKTFDYACAAVKKANIPAIEFWTWWDKDLDELLQATKKYELDISACCTKFISLVDETKREKYLIGLEESVKAAQKLNTNILISQVGDFLPQINREDQKQSLIKGLKEAAKILKNTGITLVVEPLNELLDHKGYFLVKSKEAFDIIKEVNKNEIKIIFDIYHQQISEGNLLQNILPNIDQIAHFHAAGNPGRNELQRGEINYREIFKAIQKTNYNGYVGLEYWPLDENPELALKEVSGWLK